VSLTIEVPRPAPEKHWRDRVGEHLAAVRSRITLISFGRIATSAGAVLVIAAAALWLLRSPTPAVETALPRAKGSGVTSAPSAPGSVGSSALGAVTTVASGLIVVQVAGAVVKPGVYRLPPGSRVIDLVAAAGGVEPGIDESVLPLAAKVVDGQRMYVPRPGEPVSAVSVAGASGGAGGAAAGPVNLNDATVEQLDALPGVGPSTAAAIVAYRDKHGPYRTVNGLLDVPGIGDGKLAALRDLVTV
jgi:competence protein ComEA